MQRRHFPCTRLYCVTSSALSGGRSNEDVVRQMLEAGVKLIQYREKDLSMSAKYRECQTIRELCHEFSACFIVNDDVGLALAVDADGIHLGQDDLPLAKVREIVGDEMLLGLSATSKNEALSAIKGGVADYLGVGPIFATNTKSDAAVPMGLECLDYLRQRCPIPIVAIGGINEANVTEVISHGADCAAIISDIVGAPGIGAKIARLRALLETN